MDKTDFLEAGYREYNVKYTLEECWAVSYLHKCIISSDGKYLFDIDIFFSRHETGGGVYARSQFNVQSGMVKLELYHSRSVKEIKLFFGNAWRDMDALTKIAQ